MRGPWSSLRHLPLSPPLLLHRSTCPSYPCSSAVSPAVTSASVKSTSADSASAQPCSFTSSALRLRATLSCRAPPTAAVLRLRAAPRPPRLSSHCIEIPESERSPRDLTKMVGRSTKATHSSFSGFGGQGDSSIGLTSDWTEKFRVPRRSRRAPGDRKVDRSSYANN